MKFTLAWLKDHLDTNASIEELTNQLTAIGLEVESIVNHGEALKPFTVAEVLHAEKHPSADRLQVCRVNDGKKERQIVCGAPNARAGIKVVLAREGVTIPTNGMVLKPVKIRGVDSNGMLCSARELGLGDDHEGIIELPEDAKIGESIVEALGLNDPVFDVALTPNRGDCLGVRGIARDLAAAGIGTLKPLKHTAPKGSGECGVTVHLTDPARCPMFIGCEIKGVKNGPSPEWMQRRLKAIGQKPISALVDITNYITYDLGRPLHVYDRDTLKGDIKVRPAEKLERLAALDKKTYLLFEGMTVIADDSGVIGLGGIIGGTSTSCTEETASVFLEVALFDPVSVAETGRILSIESDARHRFERYVDPAFVETGAEIAVAMIVELCGGVPTNLKKFGTVPAWKRAFTFRPARVKSLGGVDISAKEMLSTLEQLGFGVEGQIEGESVTLTPPSWRPDVEGEADVVEEILRIHSYDTIPLTPLPKPERIAPPALEAKQRRAFTLRRVMAARGMLETINWAFTEEMLARRLHPMDTPLRLHNPISEDLSALRPSLLANLLHAVKRNADRGFKDIALFEIGTQFITADPEGQQNIATGVRAGLVTPRNHYGTSRAGDVFDAKLDLFICLNTLGLKPDGLPVKREAPDWYHPGKSGALMLGKTPIAYFGELHPALLQQQDIDTSVIAFELLLDHLPEPKAKAKATLSVSNFQAVERDFAFIVDENVTAAELLRAIELADRGLITDVSLFDVYAGKGIEPGKKSMAISVTLQAKDRTLNEEEIEIAEGKITVAAAKFGAMLRQ